MQLVINQRRSAFYFAAVALLLSIIGARWSPWCYYGVALFGALTLLGVYDLAQTRRTLNRNYPILIHFRYFLESIGLEIRQYFIEADTDDRPYSREQRSLVYQRAKKTLDKRPRSEAHTSELQSLLRLSYAVFCLKKTNNNN